MHLKRRVAIIAVAATIAGWLAYSRFGPQIRTSSMTPVAEAFVEAAQRADSAGLALTTNSDMPVTWASNLRRLAPDFLRSAQLV
jgi:hypothetical protein